MQGDEPGSLRSGVIAAQQLTGGFLADTAFRLHPASIGKAVFTDAAALSKEAHTGEPV
uniref:Uncharacterized protein n=1 Tax=mine drainage metagenome TaxID=410659 RepID=E6QHQ1_9ZZZZ